MAIDYSSASFNALKKLLATAIANVRTQPSVATLSQLYDVEAEIVQRKYRLIVTDPADRLKMEANRFRTEAEAEDARKDYAAHYTEIEIINHGMDELKPLHFTPDQLDVLVRPGNKGHKVYVNSVPAVLDSDETFDIGHGPIGKIIVDFRHAHRLALASPEAQQIIDGLTFVPVQ